ncbi:MAG: DUF1957 domain-containing protein [Clostridia bacterium]|nr:DUF1957 domain-containing protein [Clostridia bacterium]
MNKGYLALVLHAHLPLVRHPESEDYIEERWLFEAITETYVPLIKVFDGLLEDGIPFALTLSLSPTLVTMLSDNLLQDRYVRYLNGLLELADREVERTRGDWQFHNLALMYQDRFREVKAIFVDKYRRNILTAFKKFQDSGCLELITCGATHGFMPLMLNESSVRAQIKTAVELHKEVFGRAPAGIWLPECGYRPGVDQILKDYGLRYFFTDTHGVLHGDPKPTYGVYAPVYCASGVAAFGRDNETARQVWSSIDGYPGDYDYREYYRDIGYDLDYDYIKPYLHKKGIRLNTGIKYYRITGKADHKEPYNPDWARKKAASHAGNFMYHREQQAIYLAGLMDRPPIVVAPYDAELFGHWWFEGPQWLDYLLRKITRDQDNLGLVTPSRYLDLYPDNESCELAMSSWGAKGYNEVWLSPANDWIYRHLHKAEERMVEVASLFPQASGITERALNQAARELLLAQSSDWAFIMKTGTMVEYAMKRTNDHLGRFEQLYHSIMKGDIDDRWLSTVEWLDKVFPNIDYRVYCTSEVNRFNQLSYKEACIAQQGKSPRVLMLSWEFPPKTVGGLARHVNDLSKALVNQGLEIHVITSAVQGCHPYENIGGVHVHRVGAYQESQGDFFNWVLQLNIKMTEYADHLISQIGGFHLLHAHDWLVAYSAKTLKHKFNIPMIATIHATEHGRNHGIHNDLQNYIHRVEWDLTYEAWRVICCSKYMEEEVIRVFNLPGDKVDVIPNGVDPVNLEPRFMPADFRYKYALPWEKIVFFLGRLVQEKGVQVLLNSVPEVLAQHPETKFLIAGRGPMLDQLQNQVRTMGLEGKVVFTGFIDDQSRNWLLHCTNVAVFPSLYEPFGIVALEAMATGVPVIVSDTGGLAEIIDYGVDGYKIIPGDAHSLATHINLMLGDEAMARGMSRKALEKIYRQYSWEGIAGETKAVYERVMTEALEEKFLCPPPQEQLVNL